MNNKKILENIILFANYGSIGGYPFIITNYEPPNYVADNYHSFIIKPDLTNPNPYRTEYHVKYFIYGSISIDKYDADGLICDHYNALLNDWENKHIYLLLNKIKNGTVCVVFNDFQYHRLLSRIKIIKPININLVLVIFNTVLLFIIAVLMVLK